MNLNKSCFVNPVLNCQNFGFSQSSGTEESFYVVGNKKKKVKDHSKYQYNEISNCPPQPISQQYFYNSQNVYQKQMHLRQPMMQWTGNEQNLNMNQNKQFNKANS